jgi:glycosyltransferase involved in cell wall biosynthesis
MDTGSKVHRQAAPSPLVSVLLPVWNAAPTLAACLRSIQRQTERRWQCVIVDDGSRDESLACARWFAHQDLRFVVVSAPHRGLVAALNTGLPSCQGRYVARMDADDLMHRHRLAAQVQALEDHPALAAVGCHVRLFPRWHLPEGRRAYERWLNSLETPYHVQRDLFVECPIAHPTLVARRGILAALGYRDRGWPEDYDLLLRLVTQGSPVGVVPRRLLSWRDSPQRLSRTNPAYTLEQFTACKTAFLAAGFLARTDAYILWGYGDTGKALRRALLAHGKTPSYIVEVHPGRIGERIHGAPVIPPEALRHVPRIPVVVSVAGSRARGEIRQALHGMEFVELHDFVCAA